MSVFSYVYVINIYVTISALKQYSISLPSRITETLGCLAALVSPTRFVAAWCFSCLLCHKLDVSFVFFFNTVNVYLDLIKFYHIFAYYSFLHFSCFWDNFPFPQSEFFGVSIRESLLSVKPLMCEDVFCLVLEKQCSRYRVLLFPVSYWISKILLRSQHLILFLNRWSDSSLCPFLRPLYLQYFVYYLSGFMCGFYFDSLGFIGQLESEDVCFGSSATVQLRRTFCDDGNVLHWCSPVWQPPAMQS